MSPESKIKLQKFTILLVAWVLLGLINSLYDYFTVKSGIVSGGDVTFNWKTSLLFSVLGALIGGLCGGYVLIYVVNEKLRNHPYWQSIVIVAAAFVLIVAGITLLMAAINAWLITGRWFSDPYSIRHFRQTVLDSIHLKNILFWSQVVALTQLFLQINDKFGQGILWDFIRGKYHSPREEERVFMFVDLMNSTHIAEKIGNENYHHLLKEFFTDITRPILHNKGEIYQYVGDEVVISWKMKNGIENNQCLKCFFDMRKTMADFGSRYLKKFGLIPEFKAGVHFGKVIAGEIGIIKRDITFSGDVLNTAARIQGKCNEYKVNFLASDALLERMNVDRQFYRIPMGRIELKGKENAVPLSTLQPR